MTVFPEKMPGGIERLRPGEAQELLIRYVRYMCERIEFYARTTDKRAERIEAAVKELQKAAPLQLDAPPYYETEGVPGQLAIYDGCAYICTDAEDDGDGGMEYTWISI